MPLPLPVPTHITGPLLAQLQEAFLPLSMQSHSPLAATLPPHVSSSAALSGAALAASDIEAKLRRMTMGSGPSGAIGSTLAAAAAANVAQGLAPSSSAFGLGSAQSRINQSIAAGASPSIPHSSIPPASSHAISNSSSTLGVGFRCDRSLLRASPVTLGFATPLSSTGTATANAAVTATTNPQASAVSSVAAFRAQLGYSSSFSSPTSYHPSSTVSSFSSVDSLAMAAGRERRTALPLPIPVSTITSLGSSQPVPSGFGLVGRKAV